MSEYDKIVNSGSPHTQIFLVTHPSHHTIPSHHTYCFLLNILNTIKDDRSYSNKQIIWTWQEVNSKPRVSGLKNSSYKVKVTQYQTSCLRGNREPSNH